MLARGEGEACAAVLVEKGAAVSDYQHKRAFSVYAEPTRSGRILVHSDLPVFQAL